MTPRHQGSNKNQRVNSGHSYCLISLESKGTSGITFSTFVLTLMNNGRITAYEFYRRGIKGQDHFIGTLPERRKDPARITENSILNWARILFSRMSEEEFRKNIYYIQVEI